MSTPLSPECEATVDRWVDAAPELSEHQRDLISAVFNGALTEKSRA